MRVAAYARISRDDDQTKTLSIESQLEEVRTFVEARGGSVIDTFIDQGFSGTLGPKHRSGLSRLLESAKAGSFTHVACWNVSRLARGYDLPGYLRTIIKEELGLEILYVQDEGSSHLERGIKGVIAAHYVEQVSADIKRSLYANAKQARPFGGPRVLGYRWEDGRRIPIPEEAAQVAAAFEAFDPQGGDASITRIAERNGWDRHRTSYLLKNPVYVGDHVFGRREKSKGKPWYSSRVTRPGVLVPDAHPAIVSRDQFDRVQAKLDSFRNSLTLRGPHGIARYALSGLLRCAECGEVMKFAGRYIGRGRWRHGLCLRYICPTCTARLNLWNGSAQLLELLAAEVSRPGLVETLVEYVRDIHDDGRRVGLLEAEVERLQKAERNLTRAITSAELDDVSTLVSQLATTQRSLRSAQAALRDERSDGVSGWSAEEIRASLANLAQRCRDLKGIDPMRVDEEARRLIHSIVERVDVESEDSAQIHLKAFGCESSANQKRLLRPSEAMTNFGSRRS